MLFKALRNIWNQTRNLNEGSAGVGRPLLESHKTPWNFKNLHYLYPEFSLRLTLQGLQWKIFSFFQKIDPEITKCWCDQSWSLSEKWRIKKESITILHYTSQNKRNTVVAFQFVIFILAYLTCLHYYIFTIQLTLYNRLI